MIDWYFGKLGPVIGIAVAIAIGVVVLAGAVSVIAGALDRDETKRRGFQVKNMNEDDHIDRS
jgi:FlaG/FlaF family flagellin (archaellin)